MKFKFKFKNILKQLQSDQEIAKIDYMKAKNELDLHMNHLNSLRKSVKESINTRIRLIEEGGQKTDAMKMYQSFVEGQSHLIDIESETIVKLEQVAEEKRLVLVEKSTEVKKFEKLREKKYQEFREALKKKEQKETDEMNTMRSNWREVV